MATHELLNDLRLDGEESEEYDDDEFYGTQALKPSEMNDETRFHMYNTEDAPQGGAVRGTYEASQHGYFISETKKSNCTVTVNRLVWVDGWSGIQDPDNAENRPLSLAVLKLTLSPENKRSYMTYASLQMKLKASTGTDNDPEIIAWGPFRHEEKWNVLETKQRTNVTINTDLSIGAASQSLQGGVNRTREVIWDEKFSDFGRAFVKCDTVNSKANPGADRAPNTVVWQVVANPHLKKGICDEFRVAILFTRPKSTQTGDSASATYRTILKIKAHVGGTFETLVRAICFGKNGKNKIEFSVDAQPGSKGKCYGEGKDIIKHIDINNLSSLRDPEDSTSLNPAWLQRWDQNLASDTKEFTTTLSPVPISATTKEAIPVATQESEPNLQQTNIESYVASRVITLANRTAPLKPTKVPSTTSVELPGNNATCSPGQIINRQLNENEGLGAHGSSSEEDQEGQDGGKDSSRCGPDCSYKSRILELEKKVERVESRLTEQEQRIRELQLVLGRAAHVLLQPALQTPNDATQTRQK